MLVKKIIIAGIFFVLLITLALVFRAIPKASPENTLRAYGTIEKVFEAADNRVVFKLKGDDRLYPIDQGLKNSLTLTTL